YKEMLKIYLDKGFSFPQAHAAAFTDIQPSDRVIDFKQPNNILGYSYLQQIRKSNLPIQVQTIKRKQSAYHEEKITSPIASATSIRKQLLTEDSGEASIKESMPIESEEALLTYKKKFGKWHEWEAYFPYIHYRVLSM